MGGVGRVRGRRAQEPEEDVDIVAGFCEEGWSGGGFSSPIASVGFQYGVQRLGAYRDWVLT